jgi:hypothetical protein
VLDWRRTADWEQAMTTGIELPKQVRVLTLVVGASVLLSALLGAALAVLLPYFVEGQRTALALFGFEVVVAVAGTLGVLLGLGRMRGSPGMALACVGGTILVGSALGWQGAGRSLADVSLTPLLALRAAAALLLMASAGLVVLMRDRAAIRPAVLGAVLGAPVVLAAAAFALPAGRRTIEGLLSGPVETSLAIMALLVLAGLLAASVHLIIGAFDLAVGDDPR